MTTYKVFVRDWWKEATTPGWPNNLEPNSMARKHTIARGVKTESEAQEICKEYNRTHKPGRLSRKAEYDRE